jgi:23S rRNA (uracil1939-C5)-methyltransferase
VTGIEGEGGLVARAASNARSNGIENVAFLVADLNEPGAGVLRQPWDLVLLDPPRTGAQQAAAHMAVMAPRRLIYVSCHPGTLARDARELVRSQGYELSAAGVLDMFPHTHHVEVMAVFDRGR